MIENDSGVREKSLLRAGWLGGPFGAGGIWAKA